MPWAFRFGDFEKNRYLVEAECIRNTTCWVLNSHYVNDGFSFDDLLTFDGFSQIDHWKTIVYDSDSWRYTIPNAGVCIQFTITDVSTICSAVLKNDCNDGFVVYLNVTEIARSNINIAGQPSYNQYALPTLSKNVTLKLTWTIEPLIDQRKE